MICICADMELGYKKTIDYRKQNLSVYHKQIALSIRKDKHDFLPGLPP